MSDESGGASAAANAGVPDRFFKCHGRWKSETAKDGYVKDSLDERLKVSRNLGFLEPTDEKLALSIAITHYPPLSLSLSIAVNTQLKY